MNGLAGTAHGFAFDVATEAITVAGSTDEDLDAAITGLLGRVAAMTGADRAYVVRLDPTGSLLSCTHEWCADDVDAQIDYVQNLSADDFRWSVDLLRSGQVLQADDIDDLPEEAVNERLSFSRYGVRSILQVPMQVEGELAGVLGFNAIHRPVPWSPEQLDVLQQAAGGIGVALARRQRTQELLAARDAAQQASVAKDRFLGQVSHELRTPLNAMLGFTELVMMGADHDETTLSHLETVIDSGRHLLTLVDDLLRISAGAEPPGDGHRLDASIALGGTTPS